MTTQQLQSILARRPLGLVFDIDGTLSPIAPTPDAARLYPGVADLLTRASQTAHVAIMTGRAVENGAAMVHVEGITYIGSHGLEWSDGLPATHTVQLVPGAEAYSTPATKLLDLAAQQFSEQSGILVEQKRVGGAIHYRLAPDPERAREQILALLTEPARTAHLRLSEGKRVIEIKTPLEVNKGVALRRFAQRFELQGLIFAGDDRTDLDAISEITSLRETGLDAASIVVQHPDTLPELLEAADIVVQEVEGMVQLLTDIVAWLR